MQFSQLLKFSVLGYRSTELYLMSMMRNLVPVINSQLVFKYDLKGDKNSSFLGPFFLSDP